MGRYGSEEELRQAVERKVGRPVRDRDWQDALEAVCAPSGVFGAADRDALVVYLRNRGYMAPKPVEDTRTRRDFRPWARLVLALDGPVQRQVRAFRRETRGSSEPPFPGDLAAAARWIEEEAAKVGQVPPPSDEDVRLLREISSRTCVRVSWSPRLLRYRVPGGNSGLCLVPGRETPLTALWWTARLVQELLGCGAEDAVSYVLTGEIPPVPPLRCQPSWTVDRSGVPRGHVTIVVSSPDVTPEEVAEAYQQARRRVWGRSRSTPATSTDADLAEFALATEGLSLEERRRRWNREHRDDRLDDEDTLRKRLERALRRVWKPPAW